MDQGASAMFIKVMRARATIDLAYRAAQLGESQQGAVCPRVSNGTGGGPFLFTSSPIMNNTASTTAMHPI